MFPLSKKIFPKQKNGKKRKQINQGGELQNQKETE
jgi:hypothetical protein